MQRYFDLADDLLKERTFANVFRLIGRWPEEIAAEYFEGKKSVKISFREWKKRAEAFGASVSGAFGEAQEYIGLKLKNSPEWGMIFFGCLMAGKMPLMIDAALDKDATQAILNRAGAKGIITEDSFAYTVPSFGISQLQSIKKDDFTPNWARKIAFCSSGTTNMQNICVMEEEAVCAQINSARIMPTYTKDIMYPQKGILKNLAILPFHHIFGFVAVFLWYTFFGKTIVYVKDLAPATILETARKAKVSHLFAVPLFWNAVAKTLTHRAETEKGKVGENLKKLIAYSEALLEGTAPKKPPVSKLFLKGIQSKVFGTNIRYMINGGGYISPRVIALINSLGYPLYNGYGLTEAGVTSVEMNPKIEERIKGNVGIPLGGVEYKIVPSDFDENEGELFISSKQIFSYRLEEGVEVPPENIEDGYLKTNDLVRKNENGTYYIIGRLDDMMINEAGENISPDEMEDYFSNVAHVSRACVIGIENDSAYDDITLVLLLSEQETTEVLEELKQELLEKNAALPLFKKVKRVIITQDPIPMANTIKVKRKQLKKGIEEHSLRFHYLNLQGETVLAEVSEEDYALIEQVKKVFQKTLEIEPERITENAHFAFDLGGDSFSYYALILNIEEEFGINIPSSEFTRLTTVNEFAAYLRATMEKGEEDVSCK